MAAGLWGKHYLTVKGWLVERERLTFQGHTFTEAARRALNGETHDSVHPSREGSALVPQNQAKPE